MARKRQRQLAQGAVSRTLKAAAAMGDEAARVALEVYEASTPFVGADDPLPVSVRGPLTALGVRGVAAIRAMRPELRADDDDVIEYLTQAWVTTMMDFDVAHFERWRARTNVGGDKTA